MEKQEIIAIAIDKFSSEVDTKEQYFNEKRRKLLKVPMQNEYVLITAMELGGFLIEFFKSDSKPDDLFSDYVDCEISFCVSSKLQAQTLFNLYK